MVNSSKEAYLFDCDEFAGEAMMSSLCSFLEVEDGPRWIDRFGRALRSWATTEFVKPIATLSLFSGGGGLDIGFHDAGFDVKQAVEIDSRFAASLSENAVAGGLLAGSQINCIDIRDFEPDKGLDIDFIIGGPPCQSFSAAGRRAAGVSGTQDDRGTLFQEYVRLLDVLKPAGFLFENVYGITGAEGGKAWQSICRAFRDVGYSITYRILDTADYGVPQHRERMFIVGVRDGSFQFPRPTHGPDSLDNRPFISASMALEDCSLSEEEAEVVLGGRYGHLLEEIPPGLNYSFFTEKMGHPRPIFGWRSKFSDFLYKADPAVPVRTLKAQGGQYTGPFHWDSRPFSVSELKRLQTFPDDFRIVGGRQVAAHQIGNSVPPQIARILALSIASQLFGVDLPCPIETLRDSDELGFRKRKRRLTISYKEKATVAIRKLTEEQPVGLKEHSCFASLGAGFAWRTDIEDGDFCVESQISGSEWIIRVRNRKGRQRKTPAFILHVAGEAANQWALNDTTVRLEGYVASEELYVACWKAFESEVIRNKIKADLVQLCEYYQYQPRFNVSLDVGSLKRWKWCDQLAQVSAGVGVGRLYHADELARLLEISKKQILNLAVWLRSLGYEIRNTATNPQIQEDHFLIPYAFPTLTPNSVQLRKLMV